DLLSLFTWSEAEFLKQTEGSAIRRIGHKRWLRNIAVALGNAPASPSIIAALNARNHSEDIDEIVREHIEWALNAQQSRLAESAATEQQKARRKTERMVRIIEKGLPRDA
ncbi:MAG: tRNA epoxyqueuosine(34) reductase QueG, partial [Shewanella oncorhynchi]